MSTSDRRSYHHGDLRAALLQSALRLLDTEGADALSLRAVARHAGVSANAPYRHYEDKEALLAALAVHGFTELRARFEAVPEHPATTGPRHEDAGRPTDPADALAPLVRATVHYALGHPGLFRLMFGHPCVSHAAVTEASDAALALVMERIAGLAGPQHLTSLKIGTWALAHGLSLLLLDGRLGDTAPDEVDTLVDTVLHTMLNTPWRSATTP